MKSLGRKVEHFLLTNTVWVFIAAIFFFSFSWVTTLYYPEIGMTVYLASEKWRLYFYFANTLLFVYSPILILSAFRSFFNRTFSTSSFLIIWLYSFLIHPFLITILEVQSFFTIFTFPSEIFLFIGLTLTFIELILLSNQYINKKVSLVSRLQQMNLEKVILLLITIIAFCSALITTYFVITEGNNRYNFTISLILYFSQLFIFLMLIYLFYWVNHYFLVKRLLKNRGFIYYIAGFITLGLLFYPFFALCVYYFPLITFEWITGPQFWIPKGERLTPFSFIEFYLPWFWMALSVPFILVYQWWKQKNDITQLEKEKSTAELNSLKQQINPHFLFNTLNSLYALSIEEKSEKTADGIAKLGTLMRYNMNDAQKQFIPLSKEIDYIKKYIELQELRLTHNNKLRVNIMEKEFSNFQIAPLLLIPFIENAFKFGLSATQKTRIDLQISIANNALVMKVFNSIIKNRAEKSGNGIGISNARKRLAQLYPNKYELIIEETPAEFEVHLEVTLFYV